MNNNTTNTLSEALSTKTKHLIIATKGDQHIKVEPNHLYEINIKEGEVLTSDINLIAKKVGHDLEVLLENNATVIFDNYFEVCTTDLSCLVSLPSKEGLYYVVDDTVTTLADGSQIVHSYGDAQALSGIAEGQSGLFETSFNDVFLAGEISALALAPLLALGGGGGDSSSGGGGPDDKGHASGTGPGHNGSSEGVYSNPMHALSIIGTDNNDIIYGTTNGIEYIEGRDGNDTIYGNGGDDIIQGNGGNDTIYGGDGNDEIDGGNGNDEIDGGNGNDIIEGGTGNDDIWGGIGNDEIKGDEGVDTIYGGAGNDIINGGDGNDIINGGDGNDIINGGDGNDDINPALKYRSIHAA